MPTVAVLAPPHLPAGAIERAVIARTPAVRVLATAPASSCRAVADSLRLAGDAEVDAVVHVSTAMVYGAWADNAVPLTEDAPLRPNPGCAEVAEAAEAERVIQEWAENHPDVRVVVLRAARTVGTLATSSQQPLPVPLPLRTSGAPVQFLHVDDLLSAIAVAATTDLRGVCNVAPDGWADADTARQLVHGPLTVPLPERAARGLAALARRTGQPTSPAAVAYRVHPWVVANDQLRAAGWRPEHTNEEAWVLTHPGSVLQELSPDRRQVLALGAVGGVLVVAGVGAFALLRRRASP